MLTCSSPAACEPLILVPGGSCRNASTQDKSPLAHRRLALVSCLLLPVMGSRLREHVRKPGSIEVENRHLWLPESHRLVQRSAALGPLSAAQYRAWVESLDPKATPAGRRIEPDRRNWGLKGVACLLKAGRECVSSAKVYWDMIASLERAGYRAGTNLYGVPFDWRFDPTENHLCADLARVLHHITNTTRWNKAYVVAHSLGNVQVLYCIQRVFGLETNSKSAPLLPAPSRPAACLPLCRLTT